MAKKNNGQLAKQYHRLVFKDRSDRNAIRAAVQIGKSRNKRPLWFADWIARKLIAVDLEGRSEVIVRMPSFPFSIGWLPDGRLLVVSGRENVLLRSEPGGSLAAKMINGDSVS